ncbi:MAG: hypothetical protein U0452_03505 [Anaerolineae bacterium]
MTTSTPVQTAEKPALLNTFFRVLLGAALLFAGISHLTFARQEFLAQVPTWLPLDGDLVVVASGIVEIALGAALILAPRRFRPWVGWMAALFFVLVFPGNISQFVNRVNAFNLNSDESRFIRLFFQPVLVIWAIWATGAWGALRRSWSRRSAPTPTA